MNHQPKLIILLTGYARSGKDTCAGILNKRLISKGYKVLQIAFAENLKLSLSKILDIPLKTFYEGNREEPILVNLKEEEMFSRMYEELQHGSLMSLDVHQIKLGNKTPHTATALLSSLLACIWRHGVCSSAGRYWISPRQLMQLWGTEVVRDTISDSTWIDSAIWEIDQSPWDIVIITDARFDVEIQSIKDKFDNVKTIEVVRSDCVKVAAHRSESGVKRDLIDISVKNDDTIEDLSKKLDAILDTLL